MNILPTHDFLLSAQLRYWEEPDETAALYTGVLSVFLNQTVEVVLVPHTRRDVLPWPPQMQDNTNTVRTPEEARRVSLALARYAVTPDVEMAGREEFVSDPGRYLPEEALLVPPSQGIIFYTTPDEYEALSDEVLLLFNRARDFRRGVPARELAGTVLLEFLLRRIIASSFFRPKDYHTLIR